MACFFSGRGAEGLDVTVTMEILTWGFGDDAAAGVQHHWYRSFSGMQCDQESTG